MRNIPKTLIKTSAFLWSIVFIVLFSGSALAEITDHGGHPEKFKGAGDKEPPRCHVDMPRASAEPFFVKWNCVDNFADQDNIRTDLWIFRKNDPAGELLKSFLGFPASVYIDEGVLQSLTFIEGLPVSFRLHASDRAGISMFTPFLTVVAQDNSLDTCDLSIVTQATDSTGSATGVPSLSVIANDVPVNTQEISENVFRIITLAEVEANICEIDSVCQNDNKITFDASIALDATNAASGSVGIVPGTVVADVTGQGTVDNAVLNKLEVSGETTIDDTPATVTLACEQ